ncbi:MAG: hypothetical protein Q9193_006308, partial [Seirophora villosa]
HPLSSSVVLLRFPNESIQLHTETRVETNTTCTWLDSKRDHPKPLGEGKGITFHHPKFKISIAEHPRPGAESWGGTDQRCPKKETAITNAADIRQRRFEFGRKLRLEGHTAEGGSRGQKTPKQESA